MAVQQVVPMDIVDFEQWLLMQSEGVMMHFSAREHPLAKWSGLDIAPRLHASSKEAWVVNGVPVPDWAQQYMYETFGTPYGVRITKATAQKWLRWSRPY